MRGRLLTTGLAIVLTVLAVGVACAQTPFIAVYWDEWYGVEGLMKPPPPECPGFGVPGMLWIALVNANNIVRSAEFAVDYPTEITWFADGNVAGKEPLFRFGTTPVGTSVAWENPGIPGWEPISLCTVAFWWNCQGCPSDDIPIVVIPHTGTGFLGFVDVNFIPHPAVGLTALLCASIPAEETTWGKVKALYGE